MKVRHDPEAEAWLEAFDPVAHGFDWDEGNRGKNERKHGVSDAEIEQLVARDDLAFAGRIVEPDRGEWRGLILAKCARRPLALIFTIRGASIRPICCRSMRSDERRTYAASKTQA